MRLLFLFLLLPQLAHALDPGRQTLTAVTGHPVAPELVLQDLDGNTWQLSGLHGRPVIINFWASWCPPCHKELPSMQRAWQQLKAEGIMILAVNIGESASAVLDFTLDYPLDFPVLLDPDSTTLDNWAGQGLPASAIIDSEGHIAYRVTGERDWDDPQLLTRILKLRRQK